MPRKKTKKEKLQSTKRKNLKTQIDPQNFTYSFSPKVTLEENKVEVKKPSTKQPSFSSNNIEKVLGYNPEYVVTDLKKTISLSLFIFAIEIGLFLALRSGLFN